MNFIRKIQSMLNKALKQFLVTASNFIGLEAAKVENKKAKIALYGIENLTKFLAFSDLGGFSVEDGKNTKCTFSSSVIGALGLTAAVTLDDILIDLGWYKDHHLGKVGSALHLGYMLSQNNQINGLVNTINSNSLVKTSLISSVLLGSSYLFGSGDMINIMRSNTNDSAQFAAAIHEISNGEVDIYTDMRVAAGFGGFIGGGRQFLNDWQLDIGGSLNGPISATINTLSHLAVSRFSEEKLKNNLLEKFQNKLSKLPYGTMSKLDYRSQKILEELPEYIEKASSSITNTAANNGISTAYQQILAASDVGFNVFIVSNLFNRASADNLEMKVTKNLKKAEVGYDFNHEAHERHVTAMQYKLEELKNKESESSFNRVTNCSRKVFDVIIPILFDSALLSMMNKADVTWNDTNTHKKFYMPVSAMCLIGKTPVDVEAFTAIAELEYLADALDAQIPQATIYI